MLFINLVVNNNNSTALHYASSKSRVEIVKLLISRGASVNIQDDQGSLPLHR